MSDIGHVSRGAYGGGGGKAVDGALDGIEPDAASEHAALLGQSVDEGGVLGDELGKLVSWARWESMMGLTDLAALQISSWSCWVMVLSQGRLIPASRVMMLASKPLMMSWRLLDSTGISIT